MTVNTNDTVERYEIDGTGPYPFSFRIFDSGDVLAHALHPSTGVSTLLTLGTSYTVSGENSEAGGSITLTSGVATTYDGYTLDVRSVVPITQPSAIKNQATLRLSSIETAIDRTTRQIQDLYRKFTQSLKLPDPSIADGTLTPLANWVGKYLTINSSGVPEPAALVEGTISKTIIGGLLFDQTQAEDNAGVIPANFFRWPGDVRRYGSTGTANDSAVLVAALAQAAQSGEKVVIPQGVTLNVKDVEFPASDISLQIDGELAGVAGGSSVLIIPAGIDRVRIDGTGRIDANGLTYGISGNGAYSAAVSIKFIGDCGNYIRFEGDYSTIDDCEHAEGYNQIVSFLVSGKSPRVSRCRLNDHRGFGIQAIFAENAIIEKNQVVCRRYSDTQTATLNQTVFTVNLTALNIERFAATRNGTQVQATYSGTGPAYTVTLGSPSAALDVVTVYGWRGAENIQINSDVDGATIIGNTCEGSGDANIVVTADYHDGVEDPGNVDEDDYPTNITITGNTTRLALANSIAVHNAVSVTIGNNTCTEFGHAYDADQTGYAAVNVNGAIHATVGDNSFHSAGNRTQYGVAGWTSIASGDDFDFRLPRIFKKYGKNSFIDTFTRHYFVAADFTDNVLRTGISITDADLIDYPQAGQTVIDAAQTVAGIPDDTAYWLSTVIAGATPCTRDTGVTVGGSASARSATGDEWELRPLAYPVFANAVLIFSFMAKNSGSNKGQVQIKHDRGAGYVTLAAKVQSTDWQPYSIPIALGSIANPLLIRFLGPPTSGNVYFQYPKIQYARFNIA